MVAKILLLKVGVGVYSYHNILAKYFDVTKQSYQVVEDISITGFGIYMVWYGIDFGIIRKDKLL